MNTTSNDGPTRLAGPKRTACSPLWNLTRALIPLILVEAALANSIPIISDGALGALAPTQNVVFNTDTGTYQIGSTVYGGARSVTLYSSVDPLSTYVFDFSSINIPTGITVTATGSTPLFLLSQGSAQINGIVDVSGGAGSAGGANGGGGGGGAGGGALGIFANSIAIGSTGEILALGGDGGLSDSGLSGMFGGIGGSAAPGAGAGGNGGASVAGGQGGYGGNGSYWLGDGGGGGGGGAMAGPGGAKGLGGVFGSNGTRGADGATGTCVPGSSGGTGGSASAGAGVGGNGGGTDAGAGLGGPGAPYDATGSGDGGGGGGGGGDNCTSLAPVGTGHAGGNGFEGGRPGGTGSNPALGNFSFATTLTSAVGGGAGGGGAIDLGSLSDSVSNSGMINVLGGSDPNGMTAGAGVVDIFGSFTNTGLVQGNLLQTSGFTADTYVLMGGGGGAGAGGDGQGFASVTPSPEPASEFLIGGGLIALAFLRRVQRSSRS